MASKQNKNVAKTKNHGWKFLLYILINVEIASPFEYQTLNLNPGGSKYFHLRSQCFISR